MLSENPRMVAVLLAGMCALVPHTASAQVDPGTPAGVQDVAPAGGLTTQEGVTTDATRCPDGSEPILQDALEDAKTTEQQDGVNKPHLCPDTGKTTRDAGVNGNESATGNATPTVK